MTVTSATADKPKKLINLSIQPDYWRQLDLFDPNTFNTRLYVIGAGRRGSHLAWVLAKMGCRRIAVYDPAEVTERDVRRGAYGPDDVGQPKVNALHRRIYDATGIKIHAVRQKLDDFAELDGAVFMAVNDPEARRSIWENSVMFCTEVPLYVDTMTTDKSGMVLAVDPSNSDHCRRYDRILKRTSGRCAPNLPTPMLDVLAGMASFRLIEHVREDRDLANQTKVTIPLPTESGGARTITPDTPLHVIGVGAVGSYAVKQLAELGYTDIRVWDFDEVENHNLPNQIFGPDDVGQLKVDALRRKVLELTGIEITAIPERYEGGDIEGALLMYVDSMKARRQIWERSAKGRPQVKLYVEGRMGISNGMFYVLNPTDERQCRLYERTLYPDEEASESACSNRAIAPSTVTLAGLTIMPFAFPGQCWRVNETIFQLMPWKAVENVW